jgi:formylglycine-generating enzyme required for sulfatase activity/Tol biopolymer transport system component
VTTGNQFYVTHCATADSVLNNPGFAVRAASTDDPKLLDAAFRFPPYELPIDSWKELPTPTDAPRRLARVAHPDGGVWVVHSSYLEKDTVDRDRSYFSHLTLMPSAGPAEVLRSWGASGWVKSYPPGAAKSLEPVTKLPVGKFVSDTALTAFLGEKSTGPTDLSVSVCPARLRGSTDERRELFARFLHAILLRAAEKNPDRRRLYVHAEPGLVALLLYGAVRLLPQGSTDHLTFSTFEPFHRNLRDYKLADVVGTYLGAPDRGLDPDLGTTRGIVLDTFSSDRSSPELRRPLDEALPAGVRDLIDLATTGEWTFLPAVRHALGRDVSALHKAGAALARARRKEAEPSPPAPTLPPVADRGPKAPARGPFPKPPVPSFAPVLPVVEEPVPSTSESGPRTPAAHTPPPVPAEPSAPVVVEKWIADTDPSPVPTPAPPIPTPPRPPTPTPPTPAASSPRPSARARRERNRFVLKLSILVALVLASVGVVAATIKFWPDRKTALVEVVKENPEQPAPAPPPPGPAPKGGKRTPVPDPPKPDPLRPTPPRPGQEVSWEIAPGVKMVFCWVPAGRAQLGAPTGEHVALTRIMPGGKRQVWMDAESASHRPNYTSAGFWLGKFEVTQTEWKAVMGTNPSLFDGKNANLAKGMDTSRFPVENVNWHDCQEFVSKLNERVGTAAPEFGMRVRVSLPHEDEWEYACRGGLGNARVFYFGDVLDGTQANVDGTAPWGALGKGTKLGRPATVGSYERGQPHPWGLCDTHGNVAEWCENRYGLGEDTRVLRGGHWAVLPWECRAAGRGRAAPAARGDKGGLRGCVRPTTVLMPPTVDPIPTLTLRTGRLTTREISLGTLPSDTPTYKNDFSVPDTRWLRHPDAPSLTKVWTGDPVVAISPDARRFAFPIRRGTRYAVVIDGKETETRYDEVRRLVFSPDGKRLAFIARRGAGDEAKWKVVVDRDEEPEYETISDGPVFSPDSKRLAYQVGVGRTPFGGVGKAAVIVDGKKWEERPYLLDTNARPLWTEWGQTRIVATLARLRFSPDSRHLAAVMWSGAGFQVVEDGVPHNLLYASIPTVRYSDDSKLLAYLGLLRNEKDPLLVGKNDLVVDGKIVLTSSEPFQSGEIVFSPDGKRIASVVNGSVRVDGSVISKGNIAREAVFSPDGKRLTYAIQRNGLWVVEVDEKEHTEPALKVPPHTLRFSPDARRVAYAATRGNNQTVIVDGADGKQWSLIATGSVTFSLDGKHVAYAVRGPEHPDTKEPPKKSPDKEGVNKWRVVVGNDEAGEYDEVWLARGFAFDAPDSFHFVAVRGREFYRVECRIGKE